MRVKSRTDDEWRTYLDRLPKVSLNKLAKKWGMNSLYGSKEKAIEILMTHLDVNGKVKKND